MSEPVFIRETSLPIDDLARRVAWLGEQRMAADSAGVRFCRTCQDGERMLYEGWYERPDLGVDLHRGLGAPRWKP